MLRFLKLQNYAKFFTEQNIPKKIHPLRPIYARKSREKPLLSTREAAMAGIFVGRRPRCAAKILTMPSRASTHAPPPRRRDARHDGGTSDEGQGQKSDTLCPDRRTHKGRQARVITPRAIYDEGRGEQRSGQKIGHKKPNTLTHSALPHQLETAITPRLTPHARLCATHSRSAAAQRVVTLSVGATKKESRKCVPKHANISIMSFSHPPLPPIVPLNTPSLAPTCADAKNDLRRWCTKKVATHAAWLPLIDTLLMRRRPTPAVTYFCTALKEIAGSALPPM